MKEFRKVLESYVLSSTQEKQDKAVEKIKSITWIVQ